nr:MAG TPA: hypothetical protein [Caudoviricetes sp.]
MATSYPGTIQLFPQMLDMTSADGVLIQQYQLAMQTGNIPLAKQILDQIPDGQNKVVTADYLNTINDTVVAVEKFFNARYSPAYIVSPTQPQNQEATDFWFQVTG